MAERLPGVDDPALSAAAEQWLTKDNPLEALRDIGQLAARGNLAAQFLANRFVHTLGNLDDEFRSLSRAEKWEVFSAPPRGDRDWRYHPYPIDSESVPALAARDEISFEMPAGDWIALTEVMLAAGMRQEALINIGIVVQQRMIDVEVLEFTTDHLTIADPQIAGYWAALISELWGRELSDADEERLSRWSVEPGDLLRRSGFYSAAESGVWSALIAGLLVSDGPEELEPFDRRNTVIAQRVFEAAFTQGEFNAADHAEDISELGRLIRGNAEQTPYLQPLIRLCSNVCQNELSQCVVSGVFNGFYHSYNAHLLEPVVAAETYYASSRAVDEVLSTVAARLNVAAGQNAQLAQQRLLPQCLLDAAS